MVWVQLFAALEILGAAGSAAASGRVPLAKMHPPKLSADGATEQSFDGPGLVCNEAFAIVLEGGERLTSRDPGLDFETYAVRGPAGEFLIYVGNAPQPHDDEIRTGLSFPSIIAIHDKRSEAQKRAGLIRNRLVVRPRFDKLCPKAG